MLPDWARRTFIASLSGMALAAASPRGRRRAFMPPAGSCDAHLHIYDPRFPYTPEARLKPPPATVSAYRSVQDELGLSRCVIVAPSSYGTDNRCTLDALREIGEAARGVVMCRSDVTDAELRYFDRCGVRGIRLSGSALLSKGEIFPLARRIEPLGWHIQVSLSAKDCLDIADVLLALPLPLVIDHFGKLSHPADRNSDEYRLMCQLLDGGRAWMKLASPYSISRSGPPDYDDISALARDYVARAPERMLWGSNWPFPDLAPDHAPDNLHLFNLLASWAPDEGVRHRILVENAEAVYGFQPGRRVAPRAIDRGAGR